MHKILPLFFFLISLFDLNAQYPGWQQSVKYVISVELDSLRHTYKGVQQLTYFNNSPDTIRDAYFHLYNNAFQPGSMMDIRSRTISDPDRRVGDRIQYLKPEEQGFLHITEILMNDKECQAIEDGTILKVELPAGLLPGDSAVFRLNFNGQVPVQVRRSGRDNKEGVDYSLSQWYPKICGYDHMGWHATPYVGREFFGTFGSFDVTIWTDPEFIVGATGYLLEESIMTIPGLQKDAMKIRRKKWRFHADRVHDFVWSADTEYKHTVHTTASGIELHCYFIPSERNRESWENLPIILEKALLYIEKKYGAYPFKKYSFLQGGDGGMEYPMATLITGERSLESLVGVSIHELMHHWYYMVLATNETLYPWMDEGFTSFADSDIMNQLRKDGHLPGKVLDDPHRGNYEAYRFLTLSGREETLSTPADHYLSNNAYGIGSYVKGALFLAQLEYILGKDNFDKGLLHYYHKWAFKHPGPWDCIRSFEEVAGMDLDWFVHYWVNSTKTIDYTIDTVYAEEGKTRILFTRKGDVPMPLDFIVKLVKGGEDNYTIPLRSQRKAKKTSGELDFAECPDWPWVSREYVLDIPVRFKDIESIEIDPRKQMADIDRSNDQWPRKDEALRH